MLFNSHIIANVGLLFDIYLDLISHRGGFLKLDLCCFFAVLVVLTANYALNAAVDEGLEIFIVQVKGLLVKCLVALPIKTIVLF